MAGKHHIWKKNRSKSCHIFCSIEMSMGFTLREDKHQAMLPKLPRRSQRLLTRSINQAPARFCTRMAASFKTTRWHYAPTLAFPSSQKLLQPHKHRNNWGTVPTYFPAYSEGSTGSHGWWTSEKQLIDQSSERYQPDRDSSSSVSKWSKHVPSLLFQSRKNGSAFCFLLTSSKRISPFLFAKYNGKQF